MNHEESLLLIDAIFLLLLRFFDSYMRVRIEENIEKLKLICDEYWIKQSQKLSKSKMFCK